MDLTRYCRIAFVCEKTIEWNKIFQEILRLKKTCINQEFWAICILTNDMIVNGGRDRMFIEMKGKNLLICHGLLNPNNKKFDILIGHSKTLTHLVRDFVNKPIIIDVKSYFEKK